MPTDRLDRTMYRLHRTLAILLLLVVALAGTVAVLAYQTETSRVCDVVVYGDQQPKADYGTATVCFRGDNGKDK